MKSLDEFKTSLPLDVIKSVVVQEESSDYSKFDVLVRAGLANKAQMQRIHTILDKMKEEKPTFNNADRMIIQNLFNKMVDLISNNKQINQLSRRVVKEDEEVPLTEAALDIPHDPPVVLVLKRQAIRLYPSGARVALYYSKTLDKHFSVAYGSGIDAPVQAEEVQIEESVMDTLHKIVKNKQVESVKFADGQNMKVDHFTASAITQVHNALNDSNKKKYADMVHKSKDHFKRASDFAFRHTK